MYISIVMVILLIFSIVLFFSEKIKLKKTKVKMLDINTVFQPIEEEEKTLALLTRNYGSMKSSYQENLKLLHQNEYKLSQYNLGVGTSDSVSYSKIYSGESIDELTDRLKRVKIDIKEMVSDKRACLCLMGKDVVVNGKKSEAKKLFNREIKLRLRCLDNEFKAAAVIVDWNNINRLLQRVKNTFNDINASGDIVKTYIQNDYLNLKIEELKLSYELAAAKSEIKELEREEAQLIRENERESVRIKNAAKKAEMNRRLMEELVAKELAKLDSSTENQKQLYEIHKQELELLRNKEAKAVSLAQLTRAGYVYVISNPLSFGDGVVKIGMTRRVDPNERVKELGDASVPELFTVHAFAFTEDAPTLESFLHKKFSNHRVNLVNSRKEFFFVPHERVVDEIKEYSGDYEFISVDTEF